MKRLLWGVGLLIVMLAGGVAAQDAEPSAELDAEMSNLEAVTIAIRELDGVPVERAFPSPDEMRAYVRDQFDRQLPGDEVGRYTRFYVALDLLSPDTDLRAVYLELLGAQVAGFYDTETQVMNVIPLNGPLTDDLTVSQEIIYVHEYTHALQDQFFGLDALLETVEGGDNVDQNLAALALVEGDATAVMTVYTQNLAAQNPLAALSLLGEGLMSGTLFLPPGTPAILSRELLFPYEGGMQFVLALYQHGGWEAVNAAYANPPKAVEHILHPQTYIDGQQPVDVTLSDAASTLGAGWAMIWETQLGEWYLREHLYTQLDGRTAAGAAAGWGGDRFHIYHNPATDELAWALRLVWDTPSDASEFDAAYAEFATERYGAEANNGCWTDAESSTCRGTVAGETLLARAPTPEQAQALLAAQGT